MRYAHLSSPSFVGFCPLSDPCCLLLRAAEAADVFKMDIFRGPRQEWEDLVPKDDDNFEIDEDLVPFLDSFFGPGRNDRRILIDIGGVMPSADQLRRV